MLPTCLLYHPPVLSFTPDFFLLVRSYILRAPFMGLGQTYCAITRRCGTNFTGRSHVGVGNLKAQPYPLL